MSYSFKLIRSEATSDKLGNCTVCDKYVSDVYHQIRYFEYAPGRHSYEGDIWGHKDCLLKQQTAWHELA